MSKNAQESAMQDFFAECEEILQRVGQTLTKMEGAGLSQDAIDALYRDVHTMKGSAQLFGFSAIGTISHAMEASLEPVRQKRMTLDAVLIDILFECLDLITRILQDPTLDLEKKPSLQKEMGVILSKLIEAATAKFEGALALRREAMPVDDNTKPLPIGNNLVSKTREPEAAMASALSSLSEIRLKKGSINLPSDTSVPTEASGAKKSPTDKPSEDHGESNSIRVQVNLLDRLMNLVGEMVLTRNQVLQFARVNENGEFLKLTQRLDLITTELQDNVMKTRMQPIGSVFSKFQRVVRDLSRDLGKQIELSVTGAETELDKSLIEAIKDPLTHIVRNACDHGIETPAIRKSNGKPDSGKLSLKAFHEGGQMIIEIFDDGGGVDPVKVKDKALQKRVITAERAAQLTDKQAQELIFMPGFTTAEQVSSVSGRGVGMDVVKTNIEKIGGVVELESVPRAYTRLRLRIPLTLAIVPAMIVSCAGESYAIPQVKLQELLRVDLEEGGKIERLHGQNFYRLRDQLLPLVNCAEVIQKEADKDRTVYNIAVLSSAHHAYGLIVDAIKDTADIVVKPLPNFLKKVDIFSGATIMGDGSVALIVDTEGLFEIAIGKRKDHQQSKQLSSVWESKKLLQTATTEYLLVKICGDTYAIPLVLVHRLEEFAPKDIDLSGDEVLVKYRGGLLPLLAVDKILNIQGQKNEARSQQPVVVISKKNRFYGLAVDEILDINPTDNEIVAHIKPRDGLLGTVIAPDGDVFTVIDTYAVINKAMGISIDQRPRAKQRAHVLLAEDTTFFVKQITKVLSDAGFEVTHAPDGEEALNLLKTYGPEEFSLIVSDIEMPKMNGFAFAEKVKTDPSYKHIPMIALTTRFREVDQEKGLKSGFDRYLEKLQSEELIETINTFLGGRI